MQPNGCLFLLRQPNGCVLQVTEGSMAMADIRHRVEIAAPPEQVYRDLITKDGFSRWWTRDVTGDTPYPDDMKISSWG